MAERRMFTQKIIDSDAFMDMPLSTQALYFHLNMRADDDGFVNNPKKIQRMVGASEDDLKLLIAKRFILAFENGVIVIKHWRMHNLIRKDRHTPTLYAEQLESLTIKDNGSYTEKALNQPDNQLATTWQPDNNQGGNQMAPQVSIGKDSIVKEILPNGSTKKSGFTPPTTADVEEYARQMGYTIDANRFCDFYESKGWMVGKNKMKDWKAKVRNWIKEDADRRGRGVSGRQQSVSKPNRFHNYQQRDTDYDKLIAENDPLMAEAIKKHNERGGKQDGICRVSDTGNENK